MWLIRKSDRKRIKNSDKRQHPVPPCSIILASPWDTFPAIEQAKAAAAHGLELDAPRSAAANPRADPAGPTNGREGSEMI